MATGACAVSEVAQGCPYPGLVSEDRRPRTTGLAAAALGLTAAAAATMFVIKVAGSAPDSDSSPRTVVATFAPSTPQATAQAATVTAVPAEVPVRIESKSASQPQLDLRQIVYTIDGNQRPDDPVTIVYADETGSLQTVQNVTLPWTMTLVPDLPVNYVTANSHGSQLNCWITDASGKTVVSQTDYGTSTTCNR